MGVDLEIFVNGYPTWVKTPLWAPLSSDLNMSDRSKKSNLILF